MYELFIKDHEEDIIHKTHDIMDAVHTAYSVSSELQSQHVGIVYNGYDPILDKDFDVTLSYISAPLMDENNMPYYNEVPNYQGEG